MLQPFQGNWGLVAFWPTWNMLHQLLTKACNHLTLINWNLIGVILYPLTTVCYLRFSGLVSIRQKHRNHISGHRLIGWNSGEDALASGDGLLLVVEICQRKWAYSNTPRPATSSRLQPKMLYLLEDSCKLKVTWCVMTVTVTVTWSDHDMTWPSHDNWPNELSSQLRYRLCLQLVAGVAKSWTGKLP